MNSVLLWRGPSEIDGKPIVLIATGIKAKSQNTKTGALVQTYIIRSDIGPTDAIHNGADVSICGACPHRGDVFKTEDLPADKRKQFENTARKFAIPVRDSYVVNRSCYVIVFQGPQNVFKYLSAGKYPDYSGQAGADLLRGLSVRLGTYGDPAAVPYGVWSDLLRGAGRSTGYTHQWKTCDMRFSDYCMASADSVEESEQAQALGYRTFRVGTAEESRIKGQEFLCPASEAAGKVTNCASCLACGGNLAPNKASVYIPAHGAAGKVKAFAERSRA